MKKFEILFPDGRVMGPYPGSWLRRIEQEDDWLGVNLRNPPRMEFLKARFCGSKTGWQYLSQFLTEHAPVWMGTPSGAQSLDPRWLDLLGATARYSANPDGGRLTPSSAIFDPAILEGTGAALTGEERLGGGLLRYRYDGLAFNNMTLTVLELPQAEGLAWEWTLSALEAFERLYRPITEAWLGFYREPLSWERKKWLAQFHREMAVSVLAREIGCTGETRLDAFRIAGRFGLWLSVERPSFRFQRNFAFIARLMQLFRRMTPGGNHNGSPKAPKALVKATKEARAELEARRHFLRERIAALAAEEQDLSSVIAPALEASYLRALGRIELDLLEMEIACARLRRECEMIVASEAGGREWSYSEITTTLDAEFSSWQEKVRQSRFRLDAAMSDEVVGAEVAAAIVPLYRSLVKRLHPDLHPELHPRLTPLWHRLQESYARFDLEDLRLIELLLDDDGPSAEPLPPPGGLAAEVVRLEGLLRSLIARIERRKQDFPFTIQELLGDPAAIERRRAERIAKLDGLRERHRQLKLQLDSLLKR